MDTFKTLRYGDRHPQVELVQVALERTGHELAADGVFGTATRGAVTQFQASRELARDGIVGTATWRALTPYLTGYLPYTVRAGDTVYDVAKRYGTEVGAILAANPRLEPRNLQIGQTITVPLWFDVVPTNIHMTSLAMMLCLDGLEARYPFLRVSAAGRSVIGRQIPAIAVGTGANRVFYNAAHHANEWLTSTLLLKFLEDYCKALVSGGGIYGLDARSLFAMTTLTLAPMVNPDGVDLVTGALTDGAEYDNAVAIAGRFPSIAFPDGWKANIVGVDPNLQYPAGWQDAVEIKAAQGFDRPAPRDWPGSAPLDAPESRAMYDLTVSDPFDLTISYHSQGEVIYWKYKDKEPPRGREIAERFGAVSGYAVEDTPSLSGNAGYKDWIIDKYDKPSYTIEIGTVPSPLPLSQFPPAYAKNLGILALGLSVTARG
ncbi:MAG: LysM peptidoglycan-binding domain-containing protein [Oscillospiraceae bacterium]|jgi:g-D-glutamyl-meso-diaminopimelate peptidase|nr:LysM peptidoglycan-binding domain-containing protein [Oscillospiraceae bacterium]